MEALKTVTGAYKCLFGIVCYADRSANRLILTSLGFVNMQVKTCTCLLFVLRYQSSIINVPSLFVTLVGCISKTLFLFLMSLLIPSVLSFNTYFFSLLCF